MLKTIKPPAKGRVEVYDTLLSNFGFRLSASGVLVWFCWFRLGEEAVRLKLGRYPAVTLADAREDARQKLVLVAR